MHKQIIQKLKKNDDLIVKHCKLQIFIAKVNLLFGQPNKINKNHNKMTTNKKKLSVNYFFYKTLVLFF